MLEFLYSLISMHIPSPIEIKKELPLKEHSFIAETRVQAARILQREDPRLALLVGPCSIHDPDMALEYAKKLRKLSSEVEHLFLVMRLFLEKPRTRVGWKGILYDPHLDGSNDIAAGLKISRQLLLDIAALQVPAATELLEPLVVPYIEDLLTWGLVGARTSASQPHRQLTSGLPFPVGFKNDIHGEIDVAVCGVISSRMGHSYLSIDPDGRIAAVKTAGNPLTHLVLRGSDTKPNCDAASIAASLGALRNNHLPPTLVVDCSHGNSGKDLQKQKGAFESIIQQVAEGNHAIAGLMLESHLFEGKQPLTTRSALHYGVSITDPCLGWEETESLIRWADEVLSMSMSSVQK